MSSSACCRAQTFTATTNGLLSRTRVSEPAVAQWRRWHRRGSEAGGADYAPTDAQVAVLAEIEKELAAATTAYASLFKNDVPAFMPG